MRCPYLSRLERRCSVQRVAHESDAAEQEAESQSRQTCPGLTLTFTQFPMASRQPPRVQRNDAVAVIDRLFGDVAGWTEAVNESANANEVAQQLYALRARHALTQKELAALVGTTQSAIARLEDANYEGHSLSLLARIAAAVGERVRVTFEQPIERAASSPPARRGSRSAPQEERFVVTRAARKKRPNRGTVQR